MFNVLLASDISSTYQALLVLAFVLFFGIYAGRYFEKIKLPHITGYIISGVLLGGVLVLLQMGELVEHLGVISSVALGFIAFGIGTELEFQKLKKSGKEVVVITLLQAFAAAALVIFALLLFGVALPIALVLGAVATATAPAPIMLLTRKYQTRGALTDTLLPLVGMDDAVGIILFGVLLSIANSMTNGASLSIIEMLEGPALELLFSALVGTVVGLIGALIIKQINTEDHQKEELYLSVSIVAVLITVALAKIGFHFGDFYAHLSPILTPMAMGIVFSNSMSRVRSHDVNITIEHFTAPILVAFFTLAGAELVVAFSQNTEVNYFSIAGITVIYILARIAGKMGGSFMGAKLMNSHRNVKKYLGLCLLPQAGVALGMAYQAKSDFGESGVTILIVVLIATLVYELFGPIGVKYSLDKSGEIRDY
ncbi:MAG: cation:proton antiporter [Candidatus Izimaplasma sp.]|nr:cation:proton antiporter [Candidatus Izimaplasma bacterium]